MQTIQLIQHHQRPVALVVAGRVLMTERLDDADQAIVAGMCAYALEIAEGDRPGPYVDAEAEAYARAVLATARHRAARARRRRRRRPIRGCRERR